MALYLSGTQLAHLYQVLQGCDDRLPRDLHPFLNALERELLLHLSVEDAELFQQGDSVVPEKISTLRYVLKQEEE